MGAEFRLRPGLWAACRRRAGRAGQVCHVSSYECLRAFACSYERLRAGSSAPGRVSSRLVAFGRVWSRQIFFSCSDTFGHVWACSFVISRHFSSFLVILRPKMAFSGMAGNGRLRHWLGGEGSSLLRMVPAPGGGWAKWHGIHLKSVCSCGRAAAALIRLAHKCTTKAGRLQLLGIPGASRNGGAFLTCSEGQYCQQLSELWFRQSVGWRQLTATAQAASSLTRIRRVAVRFWRQATCICHPLEQFFNRRGSRNRLRARGPRSQGHVPQKFGMHPTNRVHPGTGARFRLPSCFWAACR